MINGYYVVLTILLSLLLILIILKGHLKYVSIVENFVENPCTCSFSFQLQSMGKWLIFCLDLFFLMIYIQNCHKKEEFAKMKLVTTKNVVFDTL